MNFESMNFNPVELAEYFDNQDTLKHTKDLFTIPKNSTITKGNI